jgi:tRNA U34 5-carboxymethylaminomethyl modifying enzyme MnmG/GidA
LDQAQRISGITPADISLVMAHLKAGQPVSSGDRAEAED